MNAVYKIYVTFSPFPNLNFYISNEFNKDCDPIEKNEGHH